MEVTVKKDPILSEFDTGGGTREVTTVITIDSTLPIRMQRHRLVYEILGSKLDCVIIHEFLEELSDLIIDGLDQLEGQNETTLST